MADVILATGDYATPYSLSPGALLIAEPGAARAAAEALALAEVRLLGTTGFADAAAELAARGAIDLILIEAAGTPSALLDAILARGDAMARDRGVALIATTDAEGLDAVAAQLLGGPAQILCAPSLAERVSAIALAKLRPAPRLREVGRDAESARLQRLNEEVARFADLLVRLTRGEDLPRLGVRDPAPGYRGPDMVEVQPGEIRAAIRARRLRAQYFDGELFADPAWDMLLDLYAATLENQRVSVSSLCIAAAVPPTTALRWIGTMHEVGLFERHADPDDRRRAYIALSERGAAAMRAYLSAARRIGVPIA